MGEASDIRIDKIMPELFSGWITIPFEEGLIENVGSFTKLKQKATKENGRFPVVDQGEELINGFVDDEKLLFKGELPVIIFGDHTRRLKFIDFQFAVGADGTKILKPQKFLDIKFFFYYLTSLNVISEGYSRHYKFLKEVLIPIPPLPEQHRIVAKLDELMEKIEGTKIRFEKIPHINFLRKELIKLAFAGKLSQEWRKNNPEENSKDLLKTLLLITDKKGKTSPTHFVPENGLPDSPPSWTWASLGQIGKVITGKSPSKKNTKFWSGNIPFVMPGYLNKSEDCLSLKEITTTDEMVTKEGFESVQNISDDAVLVCCIGTLGRVAITRKPISFSQQLHAVVPHKNIDLEFLGYYCHLIKEMLEELWPKETYMPIVNKSLFSTIPIPIPPYEEQLFIVSELKSRLISQIKLEEHYNKAKAQFDKLPQALLAKAFKGELVEQDEEDESAGVLLERIRKEKKKKIEVYFHSK